MPTIRTLELDHLGRHLVGHVAVPDGAGPFPVVLVMSNALGLSKQARGSALALAEKGWLAVATDMYGDGFEDQTGTQSGEFYAELMGDRPKLRARCNAWRDAAAALPEADPGRVAAIGYCFGGACVLELARSGADVRAVVSYHGILETPLPARPGAIRGEVAVYAGARDPYAPPAQTEAFVREMQAAGARHSVMVFGEAAHSFTDPDHAQGHPGIEYNALAHKVSWAGTLALLELVFA
ncbi:MAG: dienelactone hydrolase family protein [Sphingomonadales bacterium]|nr:dienelactone hydrolase family protein [Sphingomonadales bacterium]